MRRSQWPRWRGVVGCLFGPIPRCLSGVEVCENYAHLAGTPPALVSRVVNVPLARLEAHLSAWLAEPAWPLVFFCRTGHRSHTAAQQLLCHGHDQIHHLARGWRWPEARLERQDNS